MREPKSSTKIKTSVSEKMITVIISFALLFLVLSIVAPLLNVLAISFNDGRDTAKGGIYFWPRIFSLANYKKVFSDKTILNAFKISVLKTVIGTAASLFFTALSAYALKVKTLPGRSFILIAIAFTMLFSGGIIPSFILLKELKLLNTFWVYIIPGLISAWNLMLMRTFFDSIPDSLEESAMIDGCGYYRIFFQIILPLSKAGLAVIGLYYAVSQWNDWFTGAFYVTDKNLQPLQTLLQRMLTSAEAAQGSHRAAAARGAGALVAKEKAQVTSDSLKMAAVVITVTPIMCVYPFIQKYFTKGVMIGSVKG